MTTERPTLNVVPMTGGREQFKERLRTAEYTDMLVIRFGLEAAEGGDVLTIEVDSTLDDREELAALETAIELVRENEHRRLFANVLKREAAHGS